MFSLAGGPSPVETPDFFWMHIPGWVWPIIICGIIGFFLVQSIKAYESFAVLFGQVGQWMHDRATKKAMDRVKRHGVDVHLLQEEMKRVLDYVERMEMSLERTTDDLECAIAYLVVDTHWHNDVDILLAEHFPGHKVTLPTRTSFSTFSRRWREGWRPPAYQED